MRGHGHSFYPGYWALYFTPRQAFVTDLAAAVRYVREDTEGAANPIVLGHLSGGGVDTGPMPSRACKTNSGGRVACCDSGKWEVHTHLQFFS